MPYMYYIYYTVRTEYKHATIKSPITTSADRHTHSQYNHEKIRICPQQCVLWR